MKKFLFLLFLIGYAPAWAQPSSVTVGEVHAVSTRMSPQTLKKRFLLKPQDPFTPELYEKAQDDLHDLRVFKKLEFSTQDRDGKKDIFIQAQDGYYIFPLAFAAGGKKVRPPFRWPQATCSNKAKAPFSLPEAVMTALPPWRGPAWGTTSFRWVTPN